MKLIECLLHLGRCWPLLLSACSVVKHEPLRVGYAQLFLTSTTTTPDNNKIHLLELSTTTDVLPVPRSSMLGVALQLTRLVSEHGPTRLVPPLYTLCDELGLR